MGTAAVGQWLSEQHVVRTVRAASGADCVRAIVVVRGGVFDIIGCVCDIGASVAGWWAHCLYEGFSLLGCSADVHVDGAFVVDSFFYLKSKSGKKTEYLPELLAEILAETGLVFVAVCSGGAAVCNPGRGGAYFKQLLAHVPQTARFLVSVVCGNDVYSSRFRDSMRFAVDDFCSEAHGRFLTHFAVVGISSATWRYDSWFASTLR